MIAALAIFLLSQGATAGYAAQGDPSVDMSKVEATARSDAGWELTSDRDGIRTYKRQIPGSPLTSFKGMGVIDTTVTRAASIIADTTRASEWVDSLKESKVVSRRTPFDYVEYNSIMTPFVLKDRDFVSRVRIGLDPAKHVLAFLYKAVEDPAMPVGKAVRGELINSSFVLFPEDGGKRALLIGEIHADPKGSCPKWIVNLFQESWPRETIENLRKQAAKRDVGESEFYAHIFD